LLRPGEDGLAPTQILILRDGLLRMGEQLCEGVRYFLCFFFFFFCSHFFLLNFLFNFLLIFRLELWHMLLFSIVFVIEAVNNGTDKGERAPPNGVRRIAGVGGWIGLEPVDCLLELC